MRVKSRWHNKAKTRTPQELGSTLAFIAWRIGMNAVKNMQKEGFNFPSYAVQLQVMEEFLPFLIQVVDRLVYGRMDEEMRRNLVTALALHLVDTMVENQVDLLGPGEYRGPLIERLNARLDDYAGFSFNGEEPGYHFLRYLGERVDAVLAKEGNRWVIEQIVDIEAPEAVKTMRKALRDVMSQGAAAALAKETGE